jgi:capsular exopolysaccharide synthesis family protein
VELRSALKLLRDQWLLISLVTLLATAISGFLTWREAPEYVSHTTLFVSAVDTSVDPQRDAAAAAYQGSLLSAQKVKSYTELLRGQQVLDRVIAELGLHTTADQLAGEVSTAAIPDTSLLTATVTDRSPQLAQRIAAALGEHFLQLVPVLEGTPEGRPPAVRVTVVRVPELPASPVSPRPVRNVSLAVLAGLAAGFGLAVARRSLDTTVKTAEQLEAATGAPSLGVVAFDSGVSKKPLFLHAPHSPRAEEFRKICTNLQFVDVDRDNKVIVVTSALANEGKSLTACNLAIALAEADKRVILVDADLRRPSTASYLGLPDGVGLTSVLVGDASLDEATQILGRGVLSVLASGPIPPNPTKLLGSHRMQELLKELRDRYDAVVIDAPPVLPVADAPVTAAASDGVILVVHHGRTRLDQLRGTLSALRNVEAPVLGTVLNLAPARSKRGYGYQYQYTTAKPAARRRAATPAAAGRPPS